MEHVWGGGAWKQRDKEGDILELSPAERHVLTPGFLLLRAESVRTCKETGIRSDSKCVANPFSSSSHWYPIRPPRCSALSHRTNIPRDPYLLVTSHAAQAKHYPSPARGPDCRGPSALVCAPRHEEHSHCARRQLARGTEQNGGTTRRNDRE